MKQKIQSILLFFFCFAACSKAQPYPEEKNPLPLEIKTGAERTDKYLPLLQGKKVGILTNHTGIIGDQHLVDFLNNAGINVVYIFAPEHGFRGNADAGEKIDNSVDSQTGIPVYSLYKNKAGRPDNQIMQEIDIVVFDIQDVGLRYYTYYISMYKMMDACAENNKAMIVLDRPNPNGFYVDGPVLDMKYKSGVGYLPIPIVHGMTLGELALMINGEKWLPGKRICNLEVITCENYTRQTRYELPVPPSPNLPNMKSVYLYASTCFFEGTSVSLGRGTEMPFQIYGSPDMKGFDFSFIPRSMPGAKNPPLKDKLCYGRDLRNLSDEEIWKEGINLNYVIEAYNTSENKKTFFKPFFENLMGVSYVREMIIQGKSNEEIKSHWKNDIDRFLIQRTPYLIYEEGHSP